MTPGQCRAIAELRAIERLSNDVLAIRGSVVESDRYVKVPIKVSTKSTRHYPGGLLFQPTEDLEIWIGPDAPLHPPCLMASDSRWWTYPHVVGRFLCLYIDPPTQWSPADGMYGFIGRMGEWLVNAAAGELDPDNGPLHPPAVFSIDYSSTALVVLSDIPESEHKRLLWANLEPRDNHRIDVTDFHRYEGKATGQLAAVVLANRPIVGVYAPTCGILLYQLEVLGFHRCELIKHIIETAHKNPQGTPLVVVVGTLNRRVNGRRLHHLVGWELPVTLADWFRGLAKANSKGEIEGTFDAINEWATREPLKWTRLYEARPSVTRRRDRCTPMAALSGKTIEIWGCGALGGWIAEFVTRAEPTTIRLRDTSRVGPGLVVRQPYDEADIARPKSEALADRLRRIHDGKVKIDVWDSDVTQIDAITADLASADLIIDATANRSVAAAIDRYAAAGPDHPPVVSVTTDARCELTAMFTAPVGSAGPGYTAQAALTRLTRNSTRHRRLIDAFWGNPGIDDLVQPEPGCSAPTFHGSAADAASAASTLVNQIAEYLVEPDLHLARFTALPHSRTSLDTSPLSVRLPCPLRINNSDGDYTVFLSAEAQATIVHLVDETFEADPQVETGGLLFGKRDDAALTITINSATGPPPDSTHSQFSFERGIEGTAQAVVAHGCTEIDAVYLGDWHTHPHGAAFPSTTDLRATQGRTDGASLILIWAGTPDVPTWVAHVIDPDLTRPPNATSTSPVFAPTPAILPISSPRQSRRAAIGSCEEPMPPRHPLPPTRPNRPAILVALSGGGFRATLAGLGVLRFLVDADLIRDTRIISSVSGGSLANAVMAVNWAQASDQPSFDKHVLSPVLDVVTNRSFRADLLRNGWRSTLPRSSRTTVLADQLDKRFLNHAMLEDLPSGCWFMFNATNVTEGVRFRFDADVVGDYVNGSIPTAGSRITLSTAVAASAAVPGPFPAIRFDHLDFPCNTGHPIRVADGGIYDNLGLEAIQSRKEFESSFLLSLNAGSLLPSDAHLGFGRLPIAGKLWRANAVMHRQINALRTRRLFLESDTREGRQFVTFNLATEFPENLSADEQKRLDRWRNLNAEHDSEAREALAAIPTTFARINRADALALVQRGWWLTGATLIVHHPWILHTCPAWRNPPDWT